MKLTPQSRLEDANKALAGAYNESLYQSMSARNSFEKETLELQRAQAHALVGILELLELRIPAPQSTEVTPTGTVVDNVITAHLDKVMQLTRDGLRAHAPHDIPPPTSAKMRHCVGCGTSHPLTTVGGRLVEHWDPATLSDIPGPTICDQRDGRAEATP